MVDSGIVENEATSGAGLFLNVERRSTASLTNVTVSGNRAVANGGGLVVNNGNPDEAVTISHSTITNNWSSTSGVGGGIFASQGRVHLDHTIVARNSSIFNQNPDLAGLIGAEFEAAHSIIGSNLGLGLTATPLGSPDADGNFIGVNPNLGPLTYLLGPTPVHSLAINSPALDAGDPLAVPGTNGVPEFDQRGAPFGRVFGSRIDIGAFESRPMSFLVDTLVDEDDGDYSAGDLSFREALAMANDGLTVDTIDFDPALFQNGPATILASTIGDNSFRGKSAFLISDSVTINGPGANLLTIDASGNDPTPDENNSDGSRVFLIEEVFSYRTGETERKSVTLAGMTLTGGDTSTDGGTNGLHGGAIRSLENLTLSRSVITNNFTSGWGGGIHSTHGNVLIDETTISGNSAESAGGVYARTPSTPITAIIRNSTISNNSTSDGVAGISVSRANLSIFHSTITGNVSENSSVGGVAASSGHAMEQLLIEHSVIAGNLGNNIASDLFLSRNATSPLPTVRYNLIGDKSNSGLAEAPVGSPDADGNLVGGPVNGIIDPLLGPLADNGGATLTHALLAGSPAIDTGDSLLVSGVGDTPRFDQRGNPFTRISGGRIDIGAYESQPLPGDFDGDGDVDGGDLDFWKSDFGSTDSSSTSDSDGDGDTDGTDFLNWQRTFGVELPGIVSASAVVEQGSAVDGGNDLAIRAEAVDLAFVVDPLLLAQPDDQPSTVETEFAIDFVLQPVLETARPVHRATVRAAYRLVEATASDEDLPVELKIDLSALDELFARL